MNTANPPQALQVLRTPRIQATPAVIGRAARCDGAPPALAEKQQHEQVQLQAAAEAAAEQARVRAEREGAQLGYAEGLRRGEQAAREQAQQAAAAARAEAAEELVREREALAALCGSLAAVRAELVQATEDDLLALCHEVLCRVLGETLLSTEGLRAQIVQLRASKTDGAAIHVHPQDLERLRGAGVDTTSGVVGDPEVRVGGCLLRLECGALDARVDTLLEEITAALLQGRRQLGAEQRP